LDLLNDYENRPTLVNNCLGYLSTKMIPFLENEPINDLMDFIIILMRKRSKSIEIEVNGMACFEELTKHEIEFKKLDTNSINKLVEVIFESNETFPDNRILCLSANVIVSGERIILNASFHNYKWITLQMDSLVNLEDNEMNESAIIICLRLMEQIMITEKSKLNSKPLYNEILLKKVESYLESASNDSFMVGNTLSLFHILNRESYNEIETKILEKLFKIIIMSMDYFSNHVDLLNITIDISLTFRCNDCM
jgi:hypothetical protein